MKIAIDGPAGAGKSTIARLIAQQLEFIYVDTSAMYRALTWKAMNSDISIDDTHSIYKLSNSTSIHFEQTPAGQKVILDGQDVTEAIRTPEVSALVSQIALNPQVRGIMVSKQKKMAAEGNVIMDGRDIGEQVLPDADYKFFITASLAERAKRRIEEMKSKGFTINEQKITDDINKRDLMDAEREIGALKILPESIVIDTTDITIKEVLTLMLAIIEDDRHVV
ncbi:MAG: (d)CMP kinase [Bacillota bacterium]|nr:(d)CMP kinase [Bacillota bacterium]